MHLFDFLTKTGRAPGLGTKFLELGWLKGGREGSVVCTPFSYFFIDLALLW